MSKNAEVKNKQISTLEESESSHRTAFSHRNDPPPPKSKNSSNNHRKNKKPENDNKRNKINKISAKVQNNIDIVDYENLRNSSKLLNDYYSPNFNLKNLNLTFRCLYCSKIPKIRFFYPIFKVLVSCPKHKKKLSYKEFLDKGYNNDIIIVSCSKCKKTHSYTHRGSYSTCLQCEKNFCPECAAKKEKCEAYNNNNSKNNKKNNNEEQFSRNHVIIKLEYFDSKCHVHTNNNFSLYCKDCQTELCTTCQENHTKGHKITSLTKYNVNQKFLDECFIKLKNETENIESVESLINIHFDKNDEDKKLKKELLNYVVQDKYALEIKKIILTNYRDKKNVYNAIRNVVKLKYPWCIPIDPEQCVCVPKELLYETFKYYLLEGTLMEQRNSESESSDDDSSSQDEIYNNYQSNNNRENNRNNKKNDKSKNNNDENNVEYNEYNNYLTIPKSRINIKDFTYKFDENDDDDDEDYDNYSNDKIKKYKEDFYENNEKSLNNMQNFICEQDEMVISCVLALKNSNFILGLSNGDLNIYKQENKKLFNRILKISEHKSGINSLCELQNNIILTASSDHYLKRIRLLNNNTGHKVECILNFCNSAIYKAIQLKTRNILSCSLNENLILWILIEKEKQLEEQTTSTTNTIQPIIQNNINNNINNLNNNKNQKETIKYKSISIQNSGNGIIDIIETKPGCFVTAGEKLQFWNLVSDKIICTSEKKISKKNYYEDKNNSDIEKGRNINNKLNNNDKIFFNKNCFNEYYEKLGEVFLKGLSYNCLCKLNSKYLFVTLGEEDKGKIALIDVENIKIINIIELCKFELTSITNFYEDSIIVSFTEELEEGNLVKIQQYRINGLIGLELVGSKSKNMFEYYEKENDNKNEKKDKNEDLEKKEKLDKKINENITAMAMTPSGLLICVGRIEKSDGINSIFGEIDLFQ